MSFLKKLFGGGDDSGSGGETVMGREDYEGFGVLAIEMKAGGEYQLCGRIERLVDGEAKAHTFIRADRLNSREQAVSAILSKGRQLVDEQGEKLFG